MKKFNLEEALSGKPVITRDGREVTQLTKFNAGNTYKLFGVVNNGIYSYTINGESLKNMESDYDLFMKTEKKSIWVNVYQDDRGLFIDTYFFETIEKALSVVISSDKDYIKTIEITNEK